MHYLFQLGREPELSAAELRAVFSLFRLPAIITNIHSSYAIVETAASLDTDFLMQKLGGTVKIGEAIRQTPAAHLVSAQRTGKILFSLSGDGGKTEALALKKELASLGRSVRYIEPKNTATILHNDLVARGGDLTNIGTDMFVTRAIQPIEAFSARDYGRPARDAKSGMLPPKLAKIMINLARVPHDAVLLDPFSGSGTILMEAALMGYSNLIGSDISKKAIADTKKNLQWIEKESGINNQARLFVCDVRNIDKKLQPRSIDAIVTEPFLGKPLRGNETRASLERQAKELEQLYLQALASFKKILAPGGKIVFITPAFRHQKEWIRIRLPFPDPPLSFARPDQLVGRDIWTS